MSWLIFWAVIWRKFGWSLCSCAPKGRLAGFNGYAVRQKYGRGVRVACDMVGQAYLKPHCLPISLSILLQLPLFGTGTVTSPLPALCLLDDTLGTSKGDLDSVLVFFLRVIIHRLPSKEHVCRRSAVRFFTSEYAKPVKTEKRTSAVSSWVAFFIGAFMSVYLRFGEVAPVRGELIYPAKGLKGKRPSLLAMETCFNTRYWCGISSPCAENTRSR